MSGRMTWLELVALGAIGLAAIGVACVILGVSFPVMAGGGAVAWLGTVIEERGKR